jgi:EpsD family peptidyl-prolyl cis-trans isomerase
MHKSFHTIGLIALAALALTACDRSVDKKPSTQIVAKVNDVEITMHQINRVVKGMQTVSVDNVASVRREALEKLIDQQIIVEKAKKENLDRTPDVIMAIEAAKKEILAKAYIQKLVMNSSKTKSNDIKEYFNEHPALFSERRIFNFEDIGFQRVAEVMPALRAEVAQQKSMSEIAAWLREKGVKYTGGTYLRPAEQIPLTILPRLQYAKAGEVVLIEIDNAVHLIHVIKYEESPIDLATATPFIKSYFINTNGKQLITDKLKQFRKEAKVEYVGEYALAAADPHALAEKTNQIQSKPSKRSSIEAGVAGLK